MHKVFDDLLCIRIPIPAEAQTAYGVHSTRGPDAAKLDVRYSQEDMRQIQEAAAILGLTRGMFIRICSTYAAKEILNHVEAYRKSNGGR